MGLIQQWTSATLSLYAIHIYAYLSGSNCSIKLDCPSLPGNDMSMGMSIVPVRPVSTIQNDKYIYKTTYTSTN